tara:strand:+ start:349 stop:582 length:234 start_codon:yes stop_codon:yes gene_type:complete
MESDSKKFALNKTDLIKILKGLALAVAGCAVAYISSDVLPYIDNTATTGAIVAGGVAVVLNIARKWVKENSPTGDVK